MEGVAAFLFDDAGYETFRAEWAPRVENCKKPFHVSECYGEYGEFSAPPFRSGDGKQMCRDLGRLIVRTRMVGYVSFITKDDWHAALKKSPKLDLLSGSPYTACLLLCAQNMAKFANERDQDIFYTFESGHAKQAEAEAFIRRAEQDERTVKQLRIGGHAFVSKRKEPTLCSADYLAWAWQRSWSDHKIDSDRYDRPHELFRILSEPPRAPVYVTQFTAGTIGLQAMFNAFYGLHKD
jgi:hypothetical protein